MIQLRSWRRGLGRGSMSFYLHIGPHTHLHIFIQAVVTFSLPKRSIEMPSLRSISYHGQYNVDNEIGIFTDELKEPAVNKAPIVLLNIA